MWRVIVSVSVYNYFLVIKKGPRQSDNAPILWVNGTFWHSIVLYIVLLVLDRQVRFFKLTVCFQSADVLPLTPLRKHFEGRKESRYDWAIIGHFSAFDMFHVK